MTAVMECVNALPRIGPLALFKLSLFAQPLYYLVLPSNALAIITLYLEYMDIIMDTVLLYLSHILIVYDRHCDFGRRKAGFAF